MCGLRIVAAATISMLLFGSADRFTAEASTITYYYVSAPYEVSNYEDGSARPIQTVGILRLAGDILPTDRTIGATEFGEEEIWPDEVEQFVFFKGENAYGVGGHSDDYVKFDGNGQIESWSLSDVNIRIDDTFGPYYTDSTDGDVVYGGPHLVPNPDAYLHDLGYRKGTPAFERLRRDEALWEYIAYTSSTGHWFLSLDDFARKVQLNAQYAVLNPPRSFYDIAPVPLPLPALMLLAGIAAIGALRLGAARRGASSLRGASASADGLSPAVVKYEPA